MISRIPVVRSQLFGGLFSALPEFDYPGCDSCMEEALAVLAAEGIPSPFVTARKPPATARMQGELLPEKVAECPGVTD